APPARRGAGRRLALPCGRGRNRAAGAGVRRVSPALIDRLVLFGATGDLAGRYLLPALARLLAAGHLPSGFELVAGARQELDDEGFRRHAAERLEEHAPDVAPDLRAALVAASTYRVVDLADPASVSSVVAGDRPVVAY